LDDVVGPVVVVGGFTVVVVVVVLAVVVVVVVVDGTEVERVVVVLVDVVFGEVVDVDATVPLLYGRGEVPKLGDAAQATCNPVVKAPIATG